MKHQKLRAYDDVNSAWLNMTQKVFFSQKAGVHLSCRLNGRKKPTKHLIDSQQYRQINNRSLQIDRRLRTRWTGSGLNPLPSDNYKKKKKKKRFGWEWMTLNDKETLSHSCSKLHCKIFIFFRSHKKIYFTDSLPIFCKAILSA